MRTMIVAVAFVAALAPAMVLAQANPATECASELWNGEYFKVQVDDGVLAEVETNVPGAISYSASDGVFSWTNQHTNDVFRWLFKSGRIDDIVFEGRWSQGDGSSGEMPESLSHVTFCFTDPEVPPSTTTEPPTTTTSSTTTTSTSTPPSTTSSTTTSLATTTTVSPTTTTQPEPTTTTAPPDPTTTTTVPDSSTTTTVPELPTIWCEWDNRDKDTGAHEPIISDWPMQLDQELFRFAYVAYDRVTGEYIGMQEFGPTSPGYHDSWVDPYPPVPETGFIVEFIVNGELYYTLDDPDCVKETPPETITTTTQPPELPYTGGELELAALIGITLLAFGGGALYLERSRG
jgi:hypothetical protein